MLRIGFGDIGDMPALLLAQQVPQGSAPAALTALPGATATGVSPTAPVICSDGSILPPGSDCTPWYMQWYVLLPLALFGGWYFLKKRKGASTEPAKTS